MKEINGFEMKLWENQTMNDFVQTPIVRRI